MLTMDPRCFAAATMTDQRTPHFVMFSKSYTADIEHSTWKMNDQARNMMNAVSQGNTAWIQHLLREGAPADCRDTHGNAPLHHAAELDHECDMHYLIEFGADVNVENQFDGSTPLMSAVEGQCFHAAKFLLRRGATVDATNLDGATALMQAVMHRWTDGNNITVLLLRCGADVNMVNWEGNTAINYATWWHTGFDAAEVLLFDYGADVYISNEDGRTPFMAANGGCHLVQALLLEVANEASVLL